jgi:phosphatidylglycerol---prolipoprotein diacylglyceryl transferase
VGPLALHPHPLFESLAYFAGFRLYLLLRARRGDHIGEQTRGAVIAAGAIGGALGSKLVSWLSDPLGTWTHVTGGDVAAVIGGKGIVGALVFGLVAVELAKRLLGVTRRTGDLFALPLAAGIAIGRIGCFLTGLEDHTHGLPSQLPWAVDFGDGIPRHPAQLYEIAFLVALSLWLWRLLRGPFREGDVFKTFMAGYLAFRLGVEFVKPGVPLAGLNATQWLCALTLLYYARDLPALAGYWLPSRLSRRLVTSDVRTEADPRTTAL